MTNPQDTSRRAIISWCLYDFANSPFTTLVVTFIFAPFFVNTIVGDKVQGTSLWSWSITASALAVALLSPLMGALADRGGYRKFFLLSLTAVSILGTVCLYWVMPGTFNSSGELIQAGDIGKALLWFLIANITYELAFVFYNAFLPDIADSDNIGRISGYGWALGYAGGLLALTLALAGLVYPETPWFGFTREAYQNLRATHLLVALWFAVFTLPLVFWVHEKPRPAPSTDHSLLRSSLIQLVNTFHEIKTYRQIVILLVARLLYNDGLITIFTFSGIYAMGTFGFTTTEMLILAIGLNVAAGLGAFAMGYLDDYVGGKRTLQLSIIGLITATFIAMVAPGKAWIWVAGILAGIFSGPNQSASRSLMGRFVPKDKENEFFGFFAFSGKATAFLGPLLFGQLTAWFDSQRAGIFIVVVLFVSGFIVLLNLDEKEGIQHAGNGPS